LEDKDYPAPLCVRHCLSEALSFGDLDDPESQVSQLIASNHTIRLNESAGTDPAVYYIPKEQDGT
jgi:Fe-S-cluster-containing dehydrogenase component